MKEPKEKVLALIPLDLDAPVGTQTAVLVSGRRICFQLRWAEVLQRGLENQDEELDLEFRVEFLAGASENSSRSIPRKTHSLVVAEPRTLSQWFGSGGRPTQTKCLNSIRAHEHGAASDGHGIVLATDV